MSAAHPAAASPPATTAGAANARATERKFLNELILQALNALQDRRLLDLPEPALRALKYVVTHMDLLCPRRPIFTDADFESSAALTTAAEKAVRDALDALDALPLDAADTSAADVDLARAKVPAFVQLAVRTLFPPAIPKPFKGLIWYTKGRHADATPPPSRTYEGWRYAAVDVGHTPGFYPDTRTVYGTYVLGPSGAGKTAYMEHQLAAEAAAVAGGGQSVAVISTTLGDVLEKTTEWYSQRTAASRADEVRGELPELLKSVVVNTMAKYTPDGPTLVVLCLDEVGVLPGLMSDKAVWTDVARAVHSIGEGAAPHAGMIAGVHVAAGGTASECGVASPLASNLAHVKKVRLAPWGLDTVMRAIRDDCDKGRALRAVVAVLCSEPHGIVSAMTNARMAVTVLQRIADDLHFLRHAWDGTAVNACYVRKRRNWLLAAVVEAYVSMNGLRRLQEALNALGANDERRNILSGVGLGALLAAMRHRLPQHNPARGTSTWTP